MDIILQHGRALEWLTSAILMGFAITLALPGNTIGTTPAFDVLRALGFTDETLSFAMGAVATMRMAGLYINGSWVRSPRLRQAGSALSAPLFGIIGTAPLASYFYGNAPVLSTGALTYLLLACADILASYRSAADAAASPRH